MASVDDRIVRMEFDNASFERKVGTTLATLGKLNDAIKTTGTDSGLANLSKMDKGFSLGGMTSAIEGVSAKFLALSTIGITVLSNITNRAVDAGISLGKSLSLDQVMEGFAEYELNMNSIQTILANTKKDGTNLQDVTGALDELNEYSDKTIYNFATMTKNIGSFTAQGVDLQTSVGSIKGISNAAAIAGSSSEQAGNAMYNLAQAIGEGELRLMNWNSVVNAGMGGETMQNALFQTGKAMGTLTGVDLDTTFEEWQASGNNFRDSLQDGWITADVLTTTLEGFSGDFDEAELAAKGFSDTMIQEFRELGELGVESATKVRTLSQLIDTTKEAVASGWSVSFRTVFGDFEEATELFTNVSEAVSGMVGNSSDARNAMLEDWKELGGRTELIEGLRLSFVNLGKIFKPIKDAFRTIFPKKTGEDLYNMTVRFREFAEWLEPTKATVVSLKAAFTGFFAAVKGIGEILWAVARGFAAMVKEILPLGDGKMFGNIASFIEKMGRAIQDFDEEKIVDFFADMGKKIKEIIPIFGEVKDALVDFFKGLDFSGIGNFFGSIGSAVGGLSFDTSVFDGLTGTLSKIADIGGKVWDVFQSIGSAVKDAWDAIGDFFSELFNVGGSAASGAGSAAGGIDWNKVGAAIGLALGGGLLVTLNKFIKAFKNFDVTGGFMDNINDVLSNTSGVLKAMQADIKAGALLKIAGAVAVLAVSLLLLSTIDGEDLAKALTAISVGMAQLIGAFAIISKISFGPKDTAKLIGLSVGLAILAGAILLLAISAKLLSTMSWEEMAIGLLATTVLLGALVGTAIALNKWGGSLIRAGVQIGVIAGALLILALAMKIFSTMSWEEIGKGLLGVGGGLVAIGVAMRIMPKDLALRSAGIVAIAFAMNLLAVSMKIFATMRWEEIAKGLAGVAGGLAAMVLAMRAMPQGQMAATAGTILALSIAMFGMALAVKKLGALSVEEIAKGVGAVIGIMVALSIAMKAMKGAEKSSLGLLLMVFSLGKLADVVKVFAGIPIGELVKGVLAMVAVIGALAATAYLITPAIGPMLLMGLALAAIGAGIALLGIGAASIAKAFQIMGAAGEKGAEGLVVAMEAIGKSLPALMKGFALGLLEIVKVIGDGIPELVKIIVKLVGALLDGLVELIPKAIKVIGTLISEILQLIQDKIPEFIETGWKIITAFFTGIRDNIGEVVTLVGEIITNFLDAFTEQVPIIVASLVDLIITIFTSVAEGVGYVAGSLMFGIGIAFMTGFFNGLKDTVGIIKTFWNGIPGDVIRWIGNVIKTLWDKGYDLVTGLLNGAKNMFKTALTWVGKIPSEVFKAIGKVIKFLWDKGVDLIAGLLNGAKDKFVSVVTWVASIPGMALRAMGYVLRTLWSKGWDLIVGLYNGISSRWNTLRTWIGGIPGKILSALGSLFTTLKSQGTNLIAGLWNGIVDRWNTLVDWFRSVPRKIVDTIGSGYTALKHIGKNLIAGLKNGIIEVWGEFSSWIWEKAKSIPGKFLDAIPLIGGPTKFTYELGMGIIDGLVMGIEKQDGLQQKAADKATAGLMSAVRSGIDEVNDLVGPNLNPTVKPVIDLTQVRRDASELKRLMPETGTASYAAASVLAASALGQAQVTDHTSKPTEVKFEQNNYSPKALTTADIHRQTRNQISMAKEELNIP